MKRIRFLHGAHQQGKSPPLPTDPRRSAQRDPFRTDWRIVSAYSLAILYFIYKLIRWNHGQYWWLIPIAPAVFAAVTFAYRAGMRSVRLKVEQKLRSGALKRTDVNPP